jgi:hypothetical protein
MFICSGVAVALASTLAVPLFLKPGQEAADKVFRGKVRLKVASDDMYPLPPDAQVLA